MLIDLLYRQTTEPETYRRHDGYSHVSRLGRPIHVSCSGFIAPIHTPGLFIGVLRLRAFSELYSDGLRAFLDGVHWLVEKTVPCRQYHISSNDVYELPYLVSIHL